ncbi:hypothetical protein [Poritiphilus flavus]|uniref:Uncharacterized protein n=1 Tax=Poritiphilus flavus TaxID=2697053 RepID=A0A6L9E8Y1_9FLAO|nr:hypothetical protein [Poritiphilus flavus]NAS11051.1 hypothetical protein [Poritiphilus flavus]
MKTTKYFTHRSCRAACRLSLFCATLGSLLFLVALVSDHEIVIGFGLVFLFLASLSSTLMLLLLFVFALIHFRRLQEFLSAMALLLLNLPLALLYFNLLIPHL